MKALSLEAARSHLLHNNALTGRIDPRIHPPGPFIGGRGDMVLSWHFKVRMGIAPHVNTFDIPHW